MKAYKGFDKNMQCLGFQYAEGGEYEEKTASLCNSGFHACIDPLHCFGYYAPGQAEFHEVEMENVSDERNSDDSKVVAKKIKIGAKLSVAQICKLHFDYTKERCTTEFTDPDKATAGEYGAATAGYGGAATAGYRGAATAGECGAATAGYRGAATAGYRGAATAGECGAATAGEYGAATAGYRGAATAGYRGAATAGYRGAATAGYRGAATAGEYGAATAGYGGAATAGYRGAATAGECGAATAGECGFALSGGTSVVGENGVAVAKGKEPKAKGGIGATLVLVQTDDDDKPQTVITVVIDGETYKADTLYTIKDGVVFEVSNA